MKKMMLTMMAAATMLASGTALAATPENSVDCRDNASCYEARFACCGGYYGGGRGRGGYGCGGGYCWGENSEG